METGFQPGSLFFLTGLHPSPSHRQVGKFKKSPWDKEEGVQGMSQCSQNAPGQDGKAEPTLTAGVLCWVLKVYISDPNTHKGPALGDSQGLRDHLGTSGGPY